MSNECIFCKIAHGEIPSENLLDTPELSAFRDINPVAPVHVLIVPKEHLGTLNDLDAKKEALAGKMLLAAREVAKKLGIAEGGYRTIINTNREAGQEVFHLHLHVIGGRPLGKMG